MLTADTDPQPVEQATSQALDAWWNFLSAVDMPEKVAAAA